MESEPRGLCASDVPLFYKIAYIYVDDIIYGKPRPALVVVSGIWLQLSTGILTNLSFSTLGLSQVIEMSRGKVVGEIVRTLSFNLFLASSASGVRAMPGASPGWRRFMCFSAASRVTPCLAQPHVGTVQRKSPRPVPGPESSPSMHSRPGWPLGQRRVKVKADTRPASRKTRPKRQKSSVGSWTRSTTFLH